MSGSEVEEWGRGHMTECPYSWGVSSVFYITFLPMRSHRGLGEEVDPQVIAMFNELAARRRRALQ